MPSEWTGRFVNLFVQHCFLFLFFYSKFTPRTSDNDHNYKLLPSATTFQLLVKLFSEVKAFFKATTPHWQFKGLGLSPIGTVPTVQVDRQRSPNFLPWNPWKSLFQILKFFKICKKRFSINWNRFLFAAKLVPQKKTPNEPGAGRIVCKRCPLGGQARDS